MTVRLQGKRAVVTAAGAGIGRACALAFRAEGARVWAVDIDAPSLETLAAQAADIEIAVLDVRDDVAVKDFFARAGSCDVLLNAVGIVHTGSVLESTLDDFAAAWDVNVASMIRTTRAALPGMLSAGAGSIVNVASVASSITGVANRAAYGTTKAAVIGLTKSVAADFVTRGIRCNALCPGTVDTPSLRARVAKDARPAEALARFEARQRMNRLGRAEEIATTAVFLASDEAAFITGQAIVVDGGWTM